MIKKVFKLYWDKDREEKWLNEMVDKGWALSNFSAGLYTFEQCEKGEYIYRIDLMEEIASSKKSIDYIKLVEETGAEYICSWARWVFFRRKASLGEFELYTDIDSKIANYKRIQQMFGILGAAEFSIGLSQVNFLFTNSYFHWANLLAMMITFALGIILSSVAIKTTIKINKLRKEKTMKE